MIVQFGAGNIGRGFLGQLWTEAGFAVTFVDVRTEMVDGLRERGEYPLLLVDNEHRERRVVHPVTAIRADDHDAVADAIARAEFVATAVGANVLTALGPVLADGIARRAPDRPPLNILCCENQNHAGALLCAAVGPTPFPVGFVDASVGRMVPPPTSELRAEDPLLIAAEPYAELPIDGDAWLGPVPRIAGLHPKANFAAYVERKLFTHNGGHACLAYLGRERGHEWIWQTVADPILVDELRGFWDETGAALIAAHGFDPAEQRRHEADLLRRFGNRALGDTVERVAADPLRKLRPDDRLVGAALLCLRHGIEPVHVARVIAAALRCAGRTELDGVPADSPLHSLVKKEL